jgi:hypothetical protein
MQLPNDPCLQIPQNTQHPEMAAQPQQVLLNMHHAYPRSSKLCAWGCHLSVGYSGTPGHSICLNEH